ncbi:MAG TPA: nuclear transport factor 2 family protein [Ktedonobacteraceae bacterium]|nr:nuclear transport factor 2 family protein [Ktedonobacteraceae bacterium]
MDEIEIVRAFMRALDAKDFPTAYSYLRSDFVYSAPTPPQPLFRNQFIEFMTALEAAIPDWSFNFHDVHRQGETVHVKIQITGTNTGVFAAPVMGISATPPTGQKIDLPEEYYECGVRDNQIFWLTLHPAPGGDISDLLRTIGVNQPIQNQVL